MLLVHVAMACRARQRRLACACGYTCRFVKGIDYKIPCACVADILSQNDYLSRRIYLVEYHWMAVAPSHKWPRSHFIGIKHNKSNLSSGGKVILQVMGGDYLLDKIHLFPDKIIILIGMRRK